MRQRKGWRENSVRKHLTYAEKSLFVKPHGSRSVPISMCMRAFVIYFVLEISQRVYNMIVEDGLIVILVVV